MACDPYELEGRGSCHVKAREPGIAREISQAWFAFASCTVIGCRDLAISISGKFSLGIVGR